VSSKIAVNFAIDPTRVIDLYREVGDDYDDRIISPAIQESVKSITAKYTAEELITKRGEVSDAILAELKGRVGQYGLIASDLNIIDFDFSESFNASIERKVTAQQDALAAENKLKQVKFEADQAIAVAKGKAEAQRIEGEALRANPEVLQLRAVEKWNGILPTYMTAGSSTPFISIK
jgi:regulator of protease activity HflC (stomatin/prohibitin superfamily)